MEEVAAARVGSSDDGLCMAWVRVEWVRRWVIGGAAWEVDLGGEERVRGREGEGKRRCGGEERVGGREGAAGKIG